jgi:hypothetical protein
MLGDHPFDQYNAHIPIPWLLDPQLFSCICHHPPPQDTKKGSLRMAYLKIRLPVERLSLPYPESRSRHPNKAEPGVLHPTITQSARNDPLSRPISRRAVSDYFPFTKSCDCSSQATLLGIILLETPESTQGFVVMG